MQISNNRPHTLLEQIVYVTCQLPARIMVNVVLRLSNKLQAYTSVKPLLIVIDYILCYVVQRLDTLGNLIDQLSKQTQNVIQSVVCFNIKLAQLLMNSLIGGCQYYTQHLKKQPPQGKITAILFAPWFMTKYAYQVGNEGAFGKAIFTQADARQCAHALDSYIRFLATLLTTMLLVPLPIIHTRKVRAFIPQSERVGTIHFSARITSSALVFVFLYGILVNKAYIIDTYLSAAIHFLLSTMATVMLTSIIIAPCERAVRFVCFNLIIAFSLCWFCSPVVFALS